VAVHHQSQALQENVAQGNESVNTFVKSTALQKQHDQSLTKTGSDKPKEKR